MGNEMENRVVDKSNDALLKYICRLGKLGAEMHKYLWVGVRNLITDWKTKHALEIKGSLNNYYMFSVQGMDSQRTQALFHKYGIKGDIITDKEAGLVAFTVNKKDIQKLLQLEKDIADNKVDVEKIYQEYFEKNGTVSHPDYDHLAEALDELQEERFPFEEGLDADIEEGDISEEFMDNNTDFSSEKELAPSEEGEENPFFEEPIFEESIAAKIDGSRKQETECPEGLLNNQIPDYPQKEAEASADSPFIEGFQADKESSNTAGQELNQEEMEGLVRETDERATIAQDSNHDYAKELSDGQNIEPEMGTSDKTDAGCIYEETVPILQKVESGHADITTSDDSTAMDTDKTDMPGFQDSRSDYPENNNVTYPYEESEPGTQDTPPGYQESFKTVTDDRSADSFSFGEDKADNAGNTYGTTSPLPQNFPPEYATYGETASRQQGVQPDYQGNNGSTIPNHNFPQETQKEREIRERNEVIYKEYENKKQRENINSVEICTGAALFTAYAGDMESITETQKNNENLENIRNARNLDVNSVQRSNPLPTVSEGVIQTAPFVQQESSINPNNKVAHRISPDSPTFVPSGIHSFSSGDAQAGFASKSQFGTQPERQADDQKVPQMGTRAEGYNASQMGIQTGGHTVPQTGSQTGGHNTSQISSQTEGHNTLQRGSQAAPRMEGQPQNQAGEHARTQTGRQFDSQASHTSGIHTNPATSNTGTRIDNTGIRIDRMELINRYHSPITKGLVLITGETLFSATGEDYRGSVYGQGKAEYSGISAWTANRGYKALGKSRENVHFKRMNKLLVKDPAQFKLLNDLLQKNGYAKMNFQNRKFSKQSMESLYSVLQKSGLASARKGAFYQKATWDLTKFNAVIKRCEKKNDFSELARMLHISGSNPLEWRSLGLFMKKTAKLNQYRSEKLKSGKSMRSLMRHSIMKESEFLKGYLQSRQAVRSVKSVYKAAKLGAILLGKTAWRATTFIASRKMLQNTAFSYEVLKINNYVKSKHVAKEEKKNLKETRKAQKRTDKQERKQEKKIRKKTKREAAWNRHAPSFLKTNSVFSKKFGSVTKKIGKGISSTKNVFSKINPFKLIGLKNAIKTKLIIIGAIAGGIFLLICLVLILVSATISSISSFFTGDKGKPVDIYDSSMGKTLIKLQKAEKDWAYKLKNDTRNIVLTDYNIRCGPNYVPIEEYKPENPNIRAYWEEHNVTWTDAGFTANPFGNFELENQGVLSNIYYVDGGVELGYQTKDGSNRTSNIKEILCMADVFFGMDPEPEDISGKESTADASVNASKSGLTYAHSNEAVSAEQKGLPSGVFWDYCQNLFNISHQEQIDFSYVVLPTCYTGGNTSAGDAFMQEISDSDITYCPKGDQGGCRIYEGFYYENSAMGVKDIDGTFHSIGTAMPAKDDNTSFAEGEANTEICTADSFGGFVSAYENNPGCWEVKEESEEYFEDDADEIHGIAATIPDGIIGEGEVVTSISQNDGIFYIETKKRQLMGPHLVWYPDHKEITLPNGTVITIPFYNSEIRMNYKMATCSYEISHRCAGKHHGIYCGGHLKADITGIICGFTDEQITSSGVQSGVVGNGAYEHTDTDYFTVKNMEGIYTADNLFEMDNCVIHSSEQKNWKGWTRDNMQLALFKYSMDWEELYGLNFGSSLGGKSLSLKSQKEILSKIKAQNPDISEERIAVIEDALSWVGNIGYDQRHHSCPLAGPCIYNPSGFCGMSDCSGFTSYVWRNRLGGVYTTASFYGIRDGGFDYDITQPGDILLHYRGAIADGKEDHALLYLGYFEYDGKADFWSIDCSTVDGIGSVFLRHRDYYGSCFYVNPTN